MIKSEIIEKMFDCIDTVYRLNAIDLNEMINRINELEDYSMTNRVIVNVRGCGSTKTYEDKDVRSLIYLAKALFSLSSKTELSKADLAREICDGYSRLRVEPFPESDKKELIDKMVNICSASPKLSIMAKASDVYEELPRRFERTRIMTDIRPIFGVTAETANTIIASVIVHTLVLTYIEGNEVKEFHVNLTSRGLNELDSVIMRARLKEEDAGNKLSEMGISIIES